MSLERRWSDRLFDVERSSEWTSFLDREPYVDIVDFRFTDLPGRWNHVVRWADALRDRGEPPLVTVASTSLMGWRAVHDSELVLRPDLATAFIDPFAAERSVVVTCGLSDPKSGAPDAKDPRATLERAVRHLQISGIADSLQVGVELEFHVFDDVRFRQSAGESSVVIEEADGADGGARSSCASRGHRIAYPEHHHATGPADWAAPLRARLLGTLREIGVAPLHHQHEAGPSQHEVTLRYSDALSAADAVQKSKYVVLSAISRMGKTATFMPKPMAYKPGSGLHLNVSLVKDGVPLFAGGQAAGLSELGCRFLAGILAHTRALNALLNPSLNSYKRLDGLYNPMMPAFYGTANRTAPVRVPHAGSSGEKRLEIRYADATANPYLAVAAVLMAGLDGIEHRLSPGEPHETDATRTMGLFDPRKRSAQSLCRSVEEAVVALDGDRAFLAKGGVFADVLIDAQLGELCRQARVGGGLPHPNEFVMFYGC